MNHFLVIGSMMNFVFPRDVRDLKIQIGIDILTTSMKESGVSADVDMTLLKARDQDHIEAAERWRDEISEAIEELGEVADRALLVLGENTDDALMSIMTDLVNSYPRVTNDLSQQPFNYVSVLIGKIASQDEKGMRATLETLSAFGKGE